MSAYQQRDGDCAVFKERDKKNPKGPDWKGSAVIDGVTYDIAFWEKGGRGTMLAGSIKVKGQPPTDRSRSQGASEGGSGGFSGGFDTSRDPFSDEVPF